MKKAIVTLAIGKRYEQNFNRFCKPLWQEYTSKYGIDLVVYSQPLDSSDKAQSRSPAWQKCLILSQPELQAYDQVVWVDSDISINPNSPDITENVPLDKIGAADEYSTPTREDYNFYIRQIYEYYRLNNIPFVESSTPSEFHRAYGLENEFNSVVQTGVMVLCPRHHKDLLEHVYHSYEDKGSKMNYEMRPLSFEILNNNFEYWISPKFNMLWPYIKTFVYPCLGLYPFIGQNLSPVEKTLRRLGIDPRSSLLRKCVTATYLSNYFLHFSAGTTYDMKFIDVAKKSAYSI